MLHGERYVYCSQSGENNEVISTHIKAYYSIEKAPSYKDVDRYGYYLLKIRQEKEKAGKKIFDKRYTIKVPACALEALLKDAKLSRKDDELL